MMMEECERAITLLGQILDDLAAHSVNMGRVQISRISRRVYGVSSLLTRALNSHISTQSKASPESLAQSSGTLAMEDTSTLVKVEICIPLLRGSYGLPEWLGRVTLEKTGSWQNNLTIDITIDDLCARKLGTELITVANLEHSPINLRLTSDLSKISNPNTSPPSQPTNVGTP